MNSFDILVIILSITLAIFLILAIIATILLIKVLKKLQSASESAKLAIDNVHSITGSLKRFASGTSAAGLVTAMWRTFKKKK